MSELKPCPFCGCEMIVRSNRDWHRPEGDHEDHCPIYDTDLMFPATDIGLPALVNCWNTRVTQPEATKPAPIPGLPFADLATPIKEFEARKAAALASPADALVAVDRVEGDLLPPIGSKVLIHLSRQDAWVEHTVTGYYVWGDLGGNKSLHRVFVRVVDADGFDNARLLEDVRAIQAQKDGHGQKTDAPQANGSEDGK